MIWKITGLAALTLLLGITIFSESDAYSLQNSVTVGDFPRDIETDENLSQMYIPNYESGTISILDSKSMIIKKTISVNEQKSNPTQIVVDPNQHLVYVSDRISGVLTVIDGAEGEITNSVKVGDSLWDLDINNENGKLYVSDLIRNEIIIVDTESLKIIKTIPTSQSPWAITINEKTNKVYVASGVSEIIHVIDGETDELIQEIFPEVKPWGLSINENNNTLYITSWDSNKIVVMELDNNQVVKEHIITPGAWQIETDQKTNTTIISNEHTNELYIFDKESELIQIISTNDSPQFITISSEMNTAYVTNPLANSVSRISYEGNEAQVKFNENSNLETQELILEVAEGIVNIPQRQDVDADLISGLLQNLGVTGEFNGNNIAQLLLDDYNKKKELEPKKVSTPIWAKDIAMRFTENNENGPMSEEIDCNDHTFPPIQDIENVNPFDIWIKILPICALS